MNGDRIGLRRRWTAAFVVGELVGFVPPAVTGATLSALHVSDAVLIAGLTVAGTLEGSVLGMAQSRVLGRSAPAVDRRHWVLATAAAAGLAWFVGMGGGAIMGSDAGSPGVLLALMVPAWLAALLSMGFLQWLVLRRAVHHSARWIPITAGAWLIGVIIPVAALSAAPNAWPSWAHAVIAVLAAVLMGATVGFLTGHTLERLLVSETGSAGEHPAPTPDAGALRRAAPPTMA